MFNNSQYPNEWYGEGNGNPLQYSCLENPMDGGAWWAAVHEVARSRTRLSDFTFTFHFHALEKEMANHASVFAWRIPRTGEPGGLPSMVLHRVRHNWSNLAAAPPPTNFISLNIFVVFASGFLFKNKSDTDLTPFVPFPYFFLCFPLRSEPVSQIRHLSFPLTLVFLYWTVFFHLISSLGEKKTNFSSI